MSLIELQARLYELLPAYGKVGKRALHPTLEYMEAWDRRLGHPHRLYPVVHVAGTNGKGSVASGLAAILQSAGYKVGLHTSPHLIFFTERMRVNGTAASPQWAEEFCEAHLGWAQKLPLSFFEFTVGMSWVWFAHEKVDIAIIEVGLGGRWDATNLVHPILSLITPIGYDHKEILGNTLAQIAREKAGIIKSKIPCLVAEHNPETDEVFMQVAALLDAPLFWAEDRVSLMGGPLVKCSNGFRRAYHVQGESIFTDLIGPYQRVNLSLILAAVNALRAQGWQIPPQAIQEGLYSVQQKTGLRARTELHMHEGKMILFESAHNPHAFSSLGPLWQELGLEEGAFVIGFSQEKEWKQAMQYLPRRAWIYPSQAQTPRALPAREIERFATEMGFRVMSLGSFVSSFERAYRKHDKIVVTGTLFGIGEVLSFWGQRDNSLGI